jgi:predicted secreted protein
MKKLSVILLFAIAAFLFVGCGDDATSVRWKSGVGGTEVADIQWTDSNYVAKQTWDETLSADDEVTVFKNVSNKYGRGVALFGGSEAEIVINGTHTGYELSEGESQELVISGSSGIAKK